MSSAGRSACAPNCAGASKRPRRSLATTDPTPRRGCSTPARSTPSASCRRATGMAWVFSNAYMRDFLTGVAQVCEPRGVGLSLVYDGRWRWPMERAQRGRRRLHPFERAPDRTDRAGRAASLAVCSAGDRCRSGRALGEDRRPQPFSRHDTAPHRARPSPHRFPVRRAPAGGAGVPWRKGSATRTHDGLSQRRRTAGRIYRRACRSRRVAGPRTGRRRLRHR